MYKVYIQTKDGIVTAINSDAFIPEDDIENWVQIDSGSGDKHHHAQGNYFPQSIMTIERVYRYKLADGKAVERTEDEIQADIDAIPPPPPTTEEKLEAAETRVSALKPLMTELVKGKPADIVISTKEFILDWVADSYEVGDVRRDANGYPKRCITLHNSITSPAHTIDVASLWAPYHGTTPETALPWIVPTGAHDMYKTGECMVWTDDLVYKCKQDTNFSPVDYAQAWELVTS